MSPPKIAIVAAYPGEIRPLVKEWESSKFKSGGRRFRLFQHGRTFVTYGGMGAVPIAAAARALVAHAKPDLLISVGWAGSLRPDLKVGSIVIPETVIEADEGRAFRTYAGAGTLVTTATVATPAQKSQIAHRYPAQAVDMEAAFVGEAAQESALKFMAVKAIFDEWDFPMPAMERFHSTQGKFRYGAFLAYAAIRPGVWPLMRLMQRNASAAAAALCSVLENLIASETLVELQQQVAKLALGVPL